MPRVKTLATGRTKHKEKKNREKSGKQNRVGSSTTRIGRFEVSEDARFDFLELGREEDIDSRRGRREEQDEEEEEEDEKDSVDAQDGYGEEEDGYKESEAILPPGLSPVSGEWDEMEILFDANRGSDCPVPIDWEAVRVFLVFKLLSPDDDTATRSARLVGNCAGGSRSAYHVEIVFDNIPCQSAHPFLAGSEPGKCPKEDECIFEVLGRGQYYSFKGPRQGDTKPYGKSQKKWITHKIAFTAIVEAGAIFYCDRPYHPSANSLDMYKKDNELPCSIYSVYELTSMTPNALDSTSNQKCDAFNFLMNQVMYKPETCLGNRYSYADCCCSGVLQKFGLGCVYACFFCIGSCFKMLGNLTHGELVLAKESGIMIVKQTWMCSEIVISSLLFSDYIPDDSPGEIFPHLMSPGKLLDWIIMNDGAEGTKTIKFTSRSREDVSCKTSEEDDMDGNGQSDMFDVHDKSSSYITRYL